MPFANLSSDPENEFFSDGLAEELLNVLARNPGLKVVGRTSSFAFKGTSEDLRVIGEKLGVENILEGSVRKAGNRVRINAQLVNATDGFHLWSETYDRVLEDIFALQDEIAGAVASALEVALRGTSQAPRPVNPEGFILSMRAAQVMSQWTDSSTNVAAGLFKQAIDLDKEDARAWAGLARALTVRAAFGFGDQDEMLRRTREALSNALSLDESSAEAHEVQGHLHFAFEHDFTAAARSFRRAHELAPSDATMLGSYAMVHIAQGDFDAGLRLLGRAVELDPLSAETHYNVGRFSWYAGKPDEGLAAIRRALELSPEMTSAWSVVAFLVSERGDFDEALVALERETGEGYKLTGQAIVNHLRGDKAASDRALAKMLDGRSSWGFQVATIHAVRGETDQALARLERAAREGDAGIPWTHVHPLLRNLWDDPRWPGLLARIGLRDSAD